MREPSAADRTRQRRIVVYWVATGLLAAEGVVGGVMGALRMQPFLGIMVHLGYPAYLMTIHGAWYVLGSFALVAPGLPRLKEWAYAGLVFTYTGAMASHLAVGDGPLSLAGPLFFLVLVAASWALRPADRRDLAPRSFGPPDEPSHG
jgi:hypothetical protein